MTPASGSGFAIAIGIDDCLANTAALIAAGCLVPRDATAIPIPISIQSRSTGRDHICRRAHPPECLAPSSLSPPRPEVVIQNFPVRALRGLAAFARDILPARHIHPEWLAPSSTPPSAVTQILPERVPVIAREAAHHPFELQAEIICRLVGVSRVARSAYRRVGRCSVRAMKKRIWGLRPQTPDGN
jgi:hypothetical protein